MYLKNGIVIAYVVNVYLFLLVVFGQHGVIDIFQERKHFLENGLKYKQIIEENRVNAIKVGLINADMVDIRYLEELLRVQYSMIKADENVVIINPSLKSQKPRIKA